MVQEFSGMSYYNHLNVNVGYHLPLTGLGLPKWQENDCTGIQKAWFLVLALLRTSCVSYKKKKIHFLSQVLIVYL